MKNKTSAWGVEVGGGGINLVSKSSIFRPLIASSLVLALGMSVGSAQTCTTTNGPVFCKNGSDQQEQVNVSDVKFEKSDGDYYSFVVGSSSATLKEGQKPNDVKIFFNAKNGNNQWKQETNQIELKEDLTLLSKNGLKMGDQGQGTLTVDMWNNGDQQSSQRTFTLDLSGVDSTHYALLGNLNITGHQGGESKYTNLTFTGKFGKGLKGNVTFDALGTANLTFSSGANLEGKVITYKGKKNTITFEGGKLLGEISIEGGGTKTTIDLKGDSSIGTQSARSRLSADNGGGELVIKSSDKTMITSNNGQTGVFYGDIKTVYVLGSDRAEFKVNFEGTKMIGDIQGGRGRNTWHSEEGQDGQKRAVTFSGLDGQTALEGNIISYGTNNAPYQQANKDKGNHVTFTNGNMKGDIKALRGGSRLGYNNVAFAGNNATLTGNIISHNDGDFGNYQSINEVKFSGANSTIKGNIQANSYGTNTIDFSKEGTITGNITADGGINTITFSKTGTINGTILAGTGGNQAINTITFKEEATINGNSSLIANNASNGNTAKSNTLTFEKGTNTITFDNVQTLGHGNTKNILKFTNGTTNTVTIKSSMTANNGSNSIQFNGTNGTNTVTINSITTNGGSNSIAKEDLSGVTNNNNTDLSSKAFTGTLQIKEGIAGSNGGWTNIAFKAKNGNQAESVISKGNNGNAISGNANIYLDMSEVTHATLTRYVDVLSKSTILGNLDSGNSGVQNIHIKGKHDKTSLTLGLTGNITNNNGSMNVIFEDSLWTPYATIKSNTGNLTKAGGMVTTDGDNAKTNIVLRKSSTSSGPAGYTPQDTTMPVYKVVSKKGETNIVMEGNISASSYISYTKGGSVNLLFANANSGSDSFASGNTDASKNKILGKTYQEGVKLALKDREITTAGDTRVSFLEKYGHYFSTHDEESLLNVTTTRVLNNGSTGLAGAAASKIQTDSVYIKGLALGDISALGGSTHSAVLANGTTYHYNVVLGAHSAFVGDMKLQDNAVINLIMEDSSKLLTDAAHLKLKTLTLKSNGYNTNEVLWDTFAQNNTIIDIATMGDALGNLKERSAFRLLEIGDAPAQAGIGATAAVQSTQNGKGLRGSGALFRVYVNVNATQQDQAAANGRQDTGVQADSGNATLGGNSNHGGANQKYGYVYSDRIIIHDGSVTINNGQQAQQAQNSDKVNYIQTIYDASTDISKLTYHGGGTEKEGNIAVATVKTSSGIKFQGATQIQGFDEVGTTLEAVDNTDQYGKVNGKAIAEAIGGAETNGYTTYFIKSAESKGASLANQLASTTALGLNYELFLANFNSLNKRMGELRNNDNGQGAWGRIFNGMLTTSYGLKTKSVYTTIQAGYDYAFGFEGANNYLGAALSYANSVIKPKNMIDIDGYGKGIDKSISNAVELALYNSYVEDSGWFNDTIFKFSYIMSSINMSGQSSEYSTNNYGIVFSDEFGYRFKLGSEKEWYIDPQLELSFGYFNQSDLKQVLGEASLTGVQDAIINLRTRVGVNWAYDFKRFTQGKEISASVYLGTYYAYDYIEGGDISLMTNLGKGINLQTLASTGRFEMNIGTNVEIKDNTRLYFDFERSFGGDITTEYQINLGVRYSFGESNGYTPINTQAIKPERAPLKIKENTQESSSDKKESATSPK